MKLTDLHIPNPCSENWNDMTPTKKGAFCGNCQIEVIDFTAKSGSEIKAILIQNRGEHLCAKMKKSELCIINHDFYGWENQTPRTFKSKFLLACVFVFGMTLFTGCSQPEEETIDVGMVEYVETDTLAENDTELPNNNNNEEFQLRTELGQIQRASLNGGEFELSTETKGRLHYTSLGDYVIDLMTLDSEYTDAVDGNTEN